MLTELDNAWTQGTFLLFHNLGPVSKGSETKKFRVTTRASGTLLGHVKWYNAWRRYCFFPLDGTVFDNKCLLEIVEFCDIKTNERKEKWKV